MNKKELAKLLLKHPLIKKINESQMWDRSIVSRVIAEELMAEQDSNQSIEDMKVAIELLKKQIAEKRQALLDAGKSWRDALEFDDEDAGDWKLLMTQLDAERRAKIKQLDAMVASYEELKNKAAETPTTKDDEMVQTAAMQDAEEIEAVNKELPRQVATINNAKEAPKAAKQAVQQVSQALDSVSTDKVKKVAKTMANASPKKQPPQDKKDSKQLPSRGWVNPFNSLKRQITTKAEASEDSQAFLDAVLDSLSEQDSGAFFKLLAPSAKSKDVKFQQALEVIEDAGVVDQFQAIIDSFKKQEPEVAVDQAMSYLGFLQEFSKLKDETKRFGDLVRGFTKQVAEKPEAPVEEAPVAKQFLQKIEKERGLATSDQLSGEDEAKRQEYIQIAESMISVVESLKNNELLQNDLAKMFVGWWLMYKKDKTLQEVLVGGELEEFKSQNKITNEETRELFTLFKEKKQAFERLMGDLESIINPQSEEEKVQTKQYLVPLANAKMPKEVLFKIAKGAGAEAEMLRNLEDPSQKDQTTDSESAPEMEQPAETEADPVVDAEPDVNADDDTLEEPGEQTQQQQISPEEVQQDLEADVTKENQTPARVYNEQQYETLATFFADKGGKGLGFMQQLLLRRQSEQLQNLIKTLEDIIDPDKNQMKSLTRGEPPAPVQEQQEETQEPIIELEPSQKRKLKSELLGLLSALKNLKTLSKAYEENMTRTSVDPRYDGSSLKARLDEMLPEIQNAIARILKMIQDFFGDLQKVEPNVVNEQQGSGLDREAKIDLVEDVYSKMRVIWSAMGPALQDTFKQEEPEGQPEPPSEPSAEPEGGSETQAENLLREKDASKATDAVVQNATDMKALATQKDFISLFPTIVFANGGEVVSIEQANKVLSGVISEFVYVMRNVVALVKGEQITQGTASEVKQKLADIANAIEESFGVPAARIVKQIEKETAGDPESQSLTDTPQEDSGGVMGTLKGLWNKLKEKFNWLSEELLKKISESIPKVELEPFLINLNRVKEWFDSLNEDQQDALNILISELGKEEGINVRMNEASTDKIWTFSENRPFSNAMKKIGFDEAFMKVFSVVMTRFKLKRKKVFQTLKIMMQKNPEEFASFLNPFFEVKGPELFQKINQVIFDRPALPGASSLPKFSPDELLPDDEEEPEDGDVEPEDGIEDEEEEEERNIYVTSRYYKEVVDQMYKLLGIKQDPENQVEISSSAQFRDFIRDTGDLDRNVRDSIRWSEFPVEDDDIADGASGLNEKELAEVFYLLNLIAWAFKAKKQVSEGLMDSMKEKGSKFFRKRSLKKRLEKKLDYKTYGTKSRFSRDLDKMDLNFLKSTDDKKKITNFFFSSLNSLEEKITEQGNSEESLREALKPIIAKMLKEHYG